MLNILPTINEKPILLRKVALSTEIINSSFSLSIAEHAIVAIALAKENQWNTDINIIKSRIYLKEFKNQLQVRDASGKVIHKKNTARDLDAAAARLKLRDIKIPLTKGIKHYSWIIDWTSSEEFDGEYLEITWHPEIVKYLFNFTKCGGSLYLMSTQGLQCLYSPRIIEILSQNKYKPYGRILYSLEEWHFLLDTPESYRTSYKDFKRYVLNVVVNDINRRGKYTIGFNETKVARKVVGLELWFKYNDVNKDKEDSERYNVI